MNLIGSTVLAWLNLVAWFVVSIVLWGNRQTVFAADETRAIVFIPLLVWLVICLGAVFCYSERSWRFIRCRWDADYLAQLRVDLKSLDVEARERRRALQTLADYSGEPSGWVGFWPFVRWEGWQFKAVRSILQKRLQMDAAAQVEAAASTSEPIKKSSPANNTGPVLEPLRCGFADTMERLSDAIEATIIDWPRDDLDQAEPAEEPLPPLQPEQFVDALRGPVEVVLSTLAATINAAPHARAVLVSRERGQEILGSFLDGALELGLSMRIEAALANQPVSQPTPSSCSSGDWDAADPLLRGPSRSWVEKYRRMKADDSNWC